MVQTGVHLIFLMHLNKSSYNDKWGSATAPTISESTITCIFLALWVSIYSLSFWKLLSIPYRLRSLNTFQNDPEPFGTFCQLRFQSWILQKGNGGFSWNESHWQNFQPNRTWRVHAQTNPTYHHTVLKPIFVDRLVAQACWNLISINTHVMADVRTLDQDNSSWLYFWLSKEV